MPAGATKACEHATHANVNPSTPLPAANFIFSGVLVLSQTQQKGCEKTHKIKKIGGQQGAKK